MPGFELFGEEEKKAINELFDSNGGVLFAHGFEGIRKDIYKVREFEQSIINKFNIKHAQAVSSGTAALRVALETINISPGDEIIIPSFTYVATAEAVLQAGAELVIVDIDDTYNIDPIALEKAITKRTKGIVPVHMMGAPADIERIISIANKFNLKVIEDTAQAMGGSVNGKYLGTFGDLGCFSFDSGKVLNTGEGGMVITNNERHFLDARSYHDHGHEYSTEKSRGEEGAIGVGFNYRMMELQGCIGIVQLSKLDTILKMQRKNKKRLKQQLVSSNKDWRFRKILDEGEIGDSLIFRLPDTKTTELFVSKMKEYKLGTKNIPDAMRWHFSKYWEHMFNKFGCYSKNYKSQWRYTSEILETSVAIPIMVKMSPDQIDNIASKLIDIANEVGL